MFTGAIMLDVGDVETFAIPTLDEYTVAVAVVFVIAILVGTTLKKQSNILHLI